ncbi:MAG: cytochrome c family protein [Zoogloeaceae bacterium]|jgi:mono/diheme cytochrome c family protein|nr:cytochrome c family protein [Zoogloeaceae bacterium]
MKNTVLFRFCLVFALTLLLAVATALLLPAAPRLAVEPARDLPLYSLPFGATKPFYPAEITTPDNKLANWRAIAGSRTCGECHPKETLEWATSMHAISDNDLIYDATVRENTDTSRAALAGHGVEKGRWCEGCHNPLGVATGAVTPASSVQMTETMEEGTACLACHAVNKAEPLAGNGALELDLNGIFRYGHPALLAAAPSRHARDMRARRDKPLMGDAALCGACHTEIRPGAVNGATPPLNLQDTYAEWRTSNWARRGIHCQDCHMARDPAAFVAALKRGKKLKKTVSHRIPGNNYLLSDTGLPQGLLMALRGGKPAAQNRLFDRATFQKALGETHDAVVALLKEAAELRIENARHAGDALVFTAAVKNAGAGHALPTGPLDQRYLWLETRVIDTASGATVFHQGAFDAGKGEEDAAAPRWMKQVTTRDGTPERRHILFDAHTLTYERKPIPAGETDRVPYRVPVADARRYRVEIRLWYRLAVQDILENIERQKLGKVAAIIPPLLLATSQVEL